MPLEIFIQGRVFKTVSPAFAQETNSEVNFIAEIVSEPPVLPPAFHFIAETLALEAEYEV